MEIVIGHKLSSNLDQSRNFHCQVHNFFGIENPVENLSESVKPGTHRLISIYNPVWKQTRCNFLLILDSILLLLGKWHLILSLKLSTRRYFFKHLHANPIVLTNQESHPFLKFFWFLLGSCSSTMNSWILCPRRHSQP
jgi:hypothetical protein